MKINEIVKEAVITQFQPGKTAQIQDKDKGVTYSLDLANPQSMGALQPDEQGKLQFDPTPPEGGSAQTSQQSTIQPGAEVAISATENIGGDHDFELEIDNPNFNPDDYDSSDTLRVGINYSISGQESPETWGHHGGQEAEHPEIDDLSVIDLDTGEDITDQVDTSEIEQAIWHREQNSDVDENVGGDPTDDFIDDVTDHEFEKANESKELSHIRRLSGL